MTVSKEEKLASILKFSDWFGEVSKEDIAPVGANGANLAEMPRANMPALEYKSGGKS